MAIMDPALASRSKGIVERTFGVFLRMLAVVSLVSGLIYWAELTGIFGDQRARFDVLTPHGRALYATLAVLMPAAALGLWLATRWGIVLWVMAALAEIIAYWLMAAQFPPRPGVAIGNAACLAVLVLTAGATLLERRAMRLSGR